jgi:hypothetical protein
MSEMIILGWMIRLVKYAIWVNYLLLLSIYRTLTLSKLPSDPPGHTVLILIFIEKPL